MPPSTGTSFPANRRANSHVDGCGERAGNRTLRFLQTSNVTTRARDKYSTAGRSKNVVAVIRQYECNLEAKSYYATRNFSSRLFLLSFSALPARPPIRSTVASRWKRRGRGLDGPGGFTSAESDDVKADGCKSYGGRGWKIKRDGRTSGQRVGRSLYS